MERYLYLKNPWWENKKFDSGVARPEYLDSLKKNFNQKLIQILTGLRRVGKSTIALQLLSYLINEKKIDPRKILFFSIEDPSISKIPIVGILNEFRAENNVKSTEKIYVFIDEIQFRDNWELEVKSIYDSENVKFVLTGSSAMLLSKRLSYLTGRYLKTQVFPLDFKEYLSFKKVLLSKTDDFLLQKHLEEYLVNGGMPEYVLNKADRYLETALESTLFKDLVTKFTLRSPEVLLDLVYLLSDRVGSTSSSLKLSSILQVNKDTTLMYITYLNKTYITSPLSNFSVTRNKEIYNPSKIYFEDNGILHKYSSKRNFGALAENAIFNHLKKLTRESRSKIGYWYDNNAEIDFVISSIGNLYFIESKWVDSATDIDFTALRTALKYLAPKKVMYLTRNLKTTQKMDGFKVNAVPLRDFLLRPQGLL